MTSTVGRLLGQSRGTIEGTHSAAERLLSTAVRYYATARVRESSLLGRLRYDAPIDPERLYDVDPRRIERTVSRTRISAGRKTEEHPLFQQPKYRLAGRVFDGDWDRVDERFTNSTGSTIGSPRTGTGPRRSCTQQANRPPVPIGSSVSSGQK